MLVLSGRDCTKSFGEILTRFFQLKQSRWGRERVEEGELEYTPSMQMAGLAAVMYAPEYSWPSVPTSSEATHALKTGINLYSATGRHSEVKTFVELLDNEVKQFIVSGKYPQMNLLTEVTEFMICYSCAD